MSKIIEPDTKFIPRVNASLEPQIDWAHGSVIIGRDRQSVSKFGLKDTLTLGVIAEQQATGASLFGYKILFDNKFPHIIFVCGKRGSGKSYTLGVIVEELGRSKSGIGTIIIDPLGTFWTMKNKNESEKAKETLSKYGLYTKDFKNIQVLTPTGFYEEMKESVDGAFSIAISDLSVDDWCMVFNIDRFKTQGLLIGDILDKINNGYFAKVGEITKKVPPKKIGYTIGDIIFCLQNDVNINSAEEGYASATKRSVIARFRAAAKWGIFSVNGTPLNKISVRNNISIIDVSHSKLGSSRRALLVGILARKILEARIEASRMEEATEMGISVKGKKSIPVTWLVIDEAHLLLPSTGKTAASESLVEYAKLGRKPGCGLVLATQRPAATNDDILSQVDTIFGHNLALEDDIGALKRRIPAKIPNEFNNSDFIRSMPVGLCLLADQKTQQRTMLVQIRPRMTHHSGKAAIPKSDEESELSELDYKDSTEKSDSEIIDASEPEVETVTSIETSSAQNDIMDTTIDITNFNEKVAEVDESSEKIVEGSVSASSSVLDIDTQSSFDSVQDKSFPKGTLPKHSTIDPKDLIWGGAYIIASKDPEFGLNILNQLSIDRHGNFLSITRTHPSRMNIELLPVNLNKIWLSKSSEKDSVPPENITKLAHLIHEFLKKNENSVIFLDGVEYLINNNDFNRIMKFIEMVHEKIIINNGILLMPINPYAILKNDLDLLENELSNKIEDPSLVKGGPAVSAVSLEKTKPKSTSESETTVRSATKDELIKLCKKLGIKTSGSIDDLKARLFEFEETGSVSEIEADEEMQKGVKVEVNEANGSLKTGKMRKEPSDSVPLPDQDTMDKDPNVQADHEKISKSKPKQKKQQQQDQNQIDLPGNITDKERALISTITEERRILESLLSERKRLEKDINKLRDKERKQKMQLERQKIREEREKLKRDKRELEDERKKLEKKLKLTIKQVTAAEKPTELPKKAKERESKVDLNMDTKKKLGLENKDKKHVKPREKISINRRLKHKSELEAGIEPLLRPSKTLKTTKTSKSSKTSEIPKRSKRTKSSQPAEKQLRDEKIKARKTKMTLLTNDQKMGGQEKLNGEKELMIKPILDLDDIEEYAIKQLKKSILNKPLEVIEDIHLVYLPLLKIYVRSMRGTIFAKEHAGAFYWDTVTGELIVDVNNILKRSKGLSTLISVTPLQAKILSELDTWGYDNVVDLESITKTSVAQIKRALGTLQKKSLVISEKAAGKKINSYKRLVELKIPNKFDKIKLEMPTIIQGVIEDNIITSQYKIKDLKKLLTKLKPATRIISEEKIFYPYYRVEITGKYGPRTILLDSVTGATDNNLAEYLHIRSLDRK